MENFFNYADANRDEDPAFIFDPTFADAVKVLGEDFIPPDMLNDDLLRFIPRRPNFRYAV